jgi:probable phosphoglycerate mutase
MFLATLLVAAAVAGPADLGPVPKSAVRVFLVRHGQAYSNLDPEPDLPPDQLDRLTDLGKQQSRRAAEALRRSGVSLILASPAGRAKGTAEELRSLLGAPPVRVDTRLRPLELGHAKDGKPLDWDARITEWEAGRDPSPAGGESMAEMGGRVYDLVHALVAEQPGKSLVLVAHSEVIGAFVGLVGRVPPPNRYPPQAKNGSITAVEMDKDGVPLLLFTYYLPPEEAAH